MTDEVIKNPLRNQGAEGYAPYTPQYQALSIKPQEINLGKSNDESLEIEDDLFEAEPIAEPRNTSSLGLNIPNVGNNEEQLWTNISSSDNKKKISQDTYVIVIKDKIFFVGSLENVEREVRSIFYGEHQLCHKEGITIDDVTVLKQMNIKIGVFVE